MKISDKIVVAAIAAVGITALVGILVQKSSLEISSVAMVRGNMRAAIVEAERVREFMSNLSRQKAFDMNNLLAESKKGGELRNSTIYQTIPVVGAWKAIEEVAKQENYQFRIAKHQARNPANLPTPAEEDILKILNTGNVEEYFNVDWKKKEIVYARPITLTSDCMLCHGSPSESPTKDGKDVLGFAMEGWKVGEVHGAFILKSSTEPVQKAVFASMRTVLAWILPLSGLVATAFWFLTRRSIIRPLSKAIEEIREAAEMTASASCQISSSSQNLAEGASAEAASLEETSASMEEMSSMTVRNAGSAVEAQKLSGEAKGVAESGMEDIEAMRISMSEIKSASDNISTILRTIDEIAFQTNILALNAAVEAARAGEAGAGFAVVADEVRSLAQRSALAAKETGERIDDSIKKSERGAQMSDKVVQHFKSILEKTRKVDHLIAEIAAASEEQKQGISQVNSTIGAMDKITQGTAASAEESAAAAQELNSQAESLKDAVQRMEIMVGATQNREGRHESPATTPAASARTRPHPKVRQPKFHHKPGALPMEDQQANRPTPAWNGRAAKENPTNDEFKNF